MGVCQELLVTVLDLFLHLLVLSPSFLQHKKVLFTPVAFQGFDDAGCRSLDAFISQFS